MFSSRYEKQAERFTSEMESYLNVAVDLEIDQRLHDSENDLMLSGLHLLTSNDRFQFSSAYLLLAQNRFTFGAAIANANLLSGVQPRQGEGLELEDLAVMLGTVFTRSQALLETADRITGHQGFLADDNYTAALKSGYGSDYQAYMGKASPTSATVTGIINAYDTLSINLLNRYAYLKADKSLANNFKIKLGIDIAPTLSEIDTIAKMIQRNRTSGFSAGSAKSLLAETMARTLGGFSNLDELALWLTVPRLKDGYFQLEHPYDELKGPERRFDPSRLGEPAIRREVQAPKPSTRPQRQFEPRVLNQSIDSERRKPENRKTFDPRALLPPKTGSNDKISRRPFDPRDL